MSKLSFIGAALVALGVACILALVWLNATVGISEQQGLAFAVTGGFAAWWGWFALEHSAETQRRHQILRDATSAYDKAVRIRDETRSRLDRMETELTEFRQSMAVR